MSCGKKEMVSQTPIPVNLSALTSEAPQIIGHTVLSRIVTAPESIRATAAISQLPAKAKMIVLATESNIVKTSTFFIPTRSAATPVGIASAAFTTPLRLFR